MQKLEQKRKEWEAHMSVVLVVPVVVDGFAKVLVVLKRTNPSRGHTYYRLHRYFPIGKNWDVSVDVDDTSDINTVLAALERDKDKNDLYGQITAQ